MKCMYIYFHAVNQNFCTYISRSFLNCGEWHAKKQQLYNSKYPFINYQNLNINCYNKIRVDLYQRVNIKTQGHRDMSNSQGNRIVGIFHSQEM